MNKVSSNNEKKLDDISFIIFALNCNVWKKTSDYTSVKNNFALVHEKCDLIWDESLTSVRQQKMWIFQ